MNARQVIITKHAYKRYRQRVGSMPLHRLSTRLNTAYMCGLYRKGLGLIRLCGVWWGVADKPDLLVLTTCYGHQHDDMIAERRRGNARQTKAAVQPARLQATDDGTVLR